MNTPPILLLGSGTFIAALAIHVIVWRAIKPAKQLLYLGFILIVLPSFMYSFLFYLSQTSAYLTKYFVSSFSIVFSFLWHLALASVYIASYPLFQAGCPSLKIVLAVSSSAPAGITAESIEKSFSQETLLNNRVNDLVNGRLVVLKNNEYTLSLKGRLLFSFFLIYRRLLGLPLGEG